MTDNLPIIEQLEQATTFIEMAKWLCACPLAIFASHGDEIEAIVSQRGFIIGQRYVSVYISAVHKTREARFKPGWQDEFDAAGEFSKDIKNTARSMDQAARETAGLDLSWHASRQPIEAANAE
ncbi:MAG: hypothetical protein CMF72_22770 [Mameliella sp.]|nr:hypothetical protein [Mameliella sp.]|tara:strand:- start:318 stop:686 length:369 start_codon:yes stop_codon:yes gene_type:complete